MENGTAMAQKNWTTLWPSNPISGYTFKRIESRVSNIHTSMMALFTTTKRWKQTQTSNKMCYIHKMECFAALIRKEILHMLQHEWTLSQSHEDYMKYIIQSRSVVTRGGNRGKWQLFNGYRVLIQQNENALEIYFTTMWIYLAIQTTYFKMVKMVHFTICVFLPQFERTLHILYKK